MARDQWAGRLRFGNHLQAANTRRYHGLLIAATNPPAARHLLLSKMEETLIVGEQRFELSTNLYPGAVHPEGYRYLSQFRLDPFPVFTFEAGGVTIEKRVFLVHDENTVVVEYETPQAGGSLELRPLIAFRGYHDLTQANRALNGHAQRSATAWFRSSPMLSFPDSGLRTTRSRWRRKAFGISILNIRLSGSAGWIATRTCSVRSCSGSI